MQFRDEAVAAANRAIDQVMSSPFTVDAGGARRSTSTSTTTARRTTRSISPSRSAFAPRSPRPLRRAACRCRRRWEPRRLEHGLGDPSHSYGTTTRRSRSGRAHGRARAAEPGAKGRGVHMKRKYKLDRHDQTPPGWLARGWPRPRWRCSSYPPRPKTSTCSSSRRLPTSGMPNVLIILDNTANWSTRVRQRETLRSSRRSTACRSTTTAAQFRVGLMMFTETGSPQQQRRRRLRPRRDAGSRPRTNKRCTWT